MFHRRPLFGLIVLLVIFGLILAGGAAAQRNAWMQGYMMGRLSSGTDGAGANTLPPFAYGGGYGWGYGGPHFGGFLGFLVVVGILFLVFGGMRRFHMMHGPWRQGMWQQGADQPDDPERQQAAQAGGPEGGPWGGPWARHGRGHRPPWWGPFGSPQQQDRPSRHGEEGGSRYV
jgi:hypothetical protein